MNRKQKKPRKIGTPPAERVGNAAAGAVLGAVVAGPVGAVAGAAVGAMVEKGMPRRKQRLENSEETDGNSRSSHKGNRRRTASDA
jgi:outer membrane lipoprotein SlyB